MFLEHFEQPFLTYTNTPDDPGYLGEAEELAALHRRTEAMDRAIRLEQQTDLLAEKNKAYDELKTVYDQTLKEANGYPKLKEKIEQIEELPQPDNIKRLQQDIQNTKEKIVEQIVIKEGL